MKYYYASLNGNAEILTAEQIANVLLKPWGKDIKLLFALEICGKTYKERKAEAINQAQTYLDTCGYLAFATITLIKIEDYFSRIANRYGLVSEFRENGII